ncbi:MAG: hypothetical protein KDE33_21670 [Bacteroidetes bacterium]|nr:hypothetical protein [Bacteroidota bacterium]
MGRLFFSGPLVQGKGNKIRINWFSNGTQLYYDGFPRSGNTYLQHLVNQVWPHLKAVHHLHTIAPIKIALSHEIPVFILWRAPGDTIASNYLKWHVVRGIEIPAASLLALNLRLLHSFLEEYIDYYSFILHNKDKLHLIHFKSLIYESEETLIRINNILPIDLKVDITTINKNVKNAKKISFGAKETYGASLPNESKDKAKLLIIKKLRTMPSFDKAQKLYLDAFKES